MFQQIRAERGERGFTLIELLIVIAILGILAGVAVFSVTAIGDNGQLASCKTEKASVLTAITAAKSTTIVAPATVDTVANGYLTTETYYKSSGGALAAIAGAPITC